MDCNGNSGNARQTGAKQLAVPQQLGSRSWINRTEYIRLLEQALQNLGFGSIARQLEAESGVLCQSSEVVALEGAVLSGSWDKAVGCLDRLRFSTEDERKQAKFFVLEQKYLEALGRRDWMSAVKCLRTELSPLDHSAKRVQCLASCILCNSPLELEGKAAWSSDLASSRQALLVSLQSIVPPDVMLPHSRLEVLVEQAIEAQLTRCLYHNTSQVSVSLLSDYKCGREQIPTCTTQVTAGNAAHSLPFRGSRQVAVTCLTAGAAVVVQLLQRAVLCCGMCGAAGGPPVPVQGHCCCGGVVGGMLMHWFLQGLSHTAAASMHQC